MTDVYPFNKVKEKLSVRVGGICMQTDKNENCTGEDVGKRIKIKRAYYKSFFERGCSGTQDFAILELEESVPDGINHICLPHRHNIDELTDPSTKVFSFGWGADPSKSEYEAAPVPYLQKVDMGMRMTEEECRKFNRQKHTDTFCVWERSEKNVCHGDSGGGVTSSLNGRSYLMGLVSHGTACTDLIIGAPPKAQMMTDIMYYTADIDTALGTRVDDRRTRWEKVSTN
ncbi:hypothetical protein Aduo_009525 [Ancylostoma duodenale]